MSILFRIARWVAIWFVMNILIVLIEKIWEFGKTNGKGIVAAPFKTIRLKFAR